MKILLTLSIAALLSGSSKDVPVLNKLIDSWHKNAGAAQFTPYFSSMTEDFVFMGTAPNERWTKDQFSAFCKPYFDKGKAWDFTPKNRNWSFSKDGKTAWFDEELDTWMQDCRGSGVCVKEKGQWKIAFYNLTVLIENEKMTEFLELRKASIEN
ncbi:MAG: nuclear transport factor 2 family protein [Bacteroidetes bacterium]|nr:nuclear transport factor 2 family protein [Bacteroidota bacterium]